MLINRYDKFPTLIELFRNTLSNKKFQQTMQTRPYRNCVGQDSNLIIHHDGSADYIPPSQFINYPQRLPQLNLMNVCFSPSLSFLYILHAIVVTTRDNPQINLNLSIWVLFVRSIAQHVAAVFIHMAAQHHHIQGLRVECVAYICIDKSIDRIDWNVCVSQYVYAPTFSYINAFNSGKHSSRTHQTTPPCATLLSHVIRIYGYCVLYT